MNRFLRLWVLFGLLCASVVAAGASDESRVFVRDGALQAEALSKTSMPAATSYEIVAGPRQDLQGVVATGSPVSVRGTLRTPLEGKGSLMFWFRSDQAYETGKGQKKAGQKLVELPGTLTVSFEADRQVVAFIVEWAGNDKDQSPRAIRIQLPEFPGPEWHHFGLSWNGPTGALNAFLDGTPYFIVGEKMEPWPVGTATEVEVSAGRFGMADVRVGPEVFSAETLAANVCGELAGRLDALLGAKALPAFSAEANRGKLLYENALADAADIRDWKLEGAGIVTFGEGWMTMKSERPAGPDGHFVLWCPKEFPEDFQAEWDFEILEQHGLCIVFFAARGHGGKDIFDGTLKPRNGTFSQYTKGDIDCYHISYFANTPGSARPVANLRKNSGFYLVSNGPVGVSPTTGIGEGKTHHAVLRKEGPHIRMSVDGRTIMDFTDDGKRAGPVLGGGEIGLRQMQWTVGRYRNFRVYGLQHPPAN